MPQAKLGQNTLIFGLGSPVTKQNYYVFTQVPTPDYVIGVAGSFTSAEALAVDSKLDDSLPGTGNVVAWGEYNTFYNNELDYDNLTATYTLCKISGSSNKYDSSNSVDRCSLIVRMGASTGNPK